jgi:hypothetical protein
MDYKVSVQKKDLKAFLRELFDDDLQLGLPITDEQLDLMVLKARGPGDIYHKRYLWDDHFINYVTITRLP